ncbi:hypothetical protein WJ03_11095 [Burkholderia vietnamiensis]|nr:hypothetical protein WJ03_11095 [Burkholderia vietnamiensis]
MHAAIAAARVGKGDPHPACRSLAVTPVPVHSDQDAVERIGPDLFVPGRDDRRRLEVHDGLQMLRRETEWDFAALGFHLDEEEAIAAHVVLENERRRRVGMSIADFGETCVQTVRIRATFARRQIVADVPGGLHNGELAILGGIPVVLGMVQEGEPLPDVDAWHAAHAAESLCAGLPFLQPELG